MPAVCRWHPGNRGIGGRHPLHMSAVHMTYSVRSRSHSCGSGDGSSIGSRNAILPHSTRAGRGTGSALTAVARTRGGSGGLVELLLMPQEQVSPSKASCTFGTLERLLFCVRPLMAFQVFQSSKPALAGRADVRSGLVRLWWGEGSRSFGVYGNCRSWFPFKFIMSVTFNKNTGSARMFRERTGAENKENGWAIAYRSHRWSRWPRQGPTVKRTTWQRWFYNPSQSHSTQSSLKQINEE